MNTGHIQVFSAYLWCTIALRWFPTERKRGESTPINMWQIIWDHGLKYSRCTTNICPSDRQRSSKMRKNESVVEGTALPILHVCGWPAAGGFHQHGNRAASVWVSVSIRAAQKERGSSRVSDCWSWIEFWQVAPSKGPAGSLEDVLPWTWTPELISRGFNQFYGCLHWFHFFWKSTGVNA